MPPHDPSLRGADTASIDAKTRPNALRRRRGAFVEGLETFAPDIVLADYKLPDFNGAGALAHVEKGKGRLYDPAAVEACIALFREKGFSIEPNSDLAKEASRIAETAVIIPAQT